MEVKQHNALPRLPVTSYQDQRKRARFSTTDEPKGFERYQYQQALLRSMSVLGGTGDDGGASPARYLGGGDDQPL